MPFERGGPPKPKIKDHFALTNVMLRSLKPTKSLLRSRDFEALAVQSTFYRNCREQGISNPMAVDGVKACILVRELIDCSRDAIGQLAANIGLRKQVADTDTSVKVGSVRIEPYADFGEYYDFPDKDSNFAINAISIHLSTPQSGHARELLRDIGKTAKYIQKFPKLSATSRVIGVTFPELVASAERFGMLSTSVHITELPEKIITAHQDAFYLVNGISRTEPCVPLAAHLPTQEFVERFSRFAE